MSESRGPGHPARFASLLLLLGLCAGGLVSSSLLRGAGVQAATAPTAKSAVNDTVILLDVTGSMAGGGTDPRARNIWKQVVQAAANLILRQPTGTHLAIIPFDAGPAWAEIYPTPLQSAGNLTWQALSIAAQQRAIPKYLASLNPTGQITDIYDSVQYALQQLNRWDPHHAHVQALYLYTDGLDNGPHQNLGIAGIAALFGAAHADNPYLYTVYNDLARQLPDSAVKRLERNGAHVVTSPALGQLAPSVTLSTLHVDLGDLSRRPNRSVTVAVRFKQVTPDLTGRALSVVLSSKSPGLHLRSATAVLKGTVSVVLDTSSSSPGVHTAQLTFSASRNDFTIVPRGLIEVSFSWLFAPSASATARAEVHGTQVAKAKAHATVVAAAATARALKTAIAVVHLHVAQTAVAHGTATAQAQRRETQTAVVQVATAAAGATGTTVAEAAESATAVVAARSATALSQAQSAATVGGLATQTAVAGLTATAEEQATQTAVARSARDAAQTATAVAQSTATAGSAVSATAAALATGAAMETATAAVPTQTATVGVVAQTPTIDLGHVAFRKQGPLGLDG